LKAPHVDDVLRELRNVTGVSLSRADDVQNQYSAFGSLSLRNVPAWQVMDNLAASKRVEGRWETDGSGYRLVPNGKPVSITELSAAGSALSPMTTWLLIMAVPALAAFGAGVWLVVRKWRRGQGPAVSGQRAPTPKSPGMPGEGKGGRGASG
jgi:hypothetical protein